VRYGKGHPTEEHPVTDVMDAAHPGKVSAALNCLSCHQPHAGNSNGMLVKDQANNMEFCRSCHNNPLDLKSVKSGGQ